MAKWVAMMCLCQAWGLFFTLEPRIERCVGVSMKEKAEFTGTYIFTGSHERNVVARVKSPQGFILHQSPRGVREGKFELSSQEAGVYKLCFRATDNEQKIISFDMSPKEIPKDENVVTGSDVEPLADMLLTMSRGYNSISRNIHFYQLRERAHRDLAEQTCERVLWCAVAKILILSFISLTQIYTMKGLLSTKVSQTI